MTWIKFKDRIPKDHAVFITDWCSTWTAYITPLETWEDFAESNPEYAWTSIEVPETPEEPVELHRCISETLTCYEVNNGSLRLRDNNIETHLLGEYVNFCPFCGFQAPKASLAQG